jgi:thiol:disulfide interchange protein DsbD
MPESPFTKGAIALFLLLAVMCGYRLFHPSTTFAADGADPDWDAAVAQSKASHQPTVLLFTAQWCPACRALHSSVLSVPQVQSELGHFNYFTVDLTNPPPQIQERAAKYRVHAIPTMIRFDADGKETDRVNYLPASELIDWLKAGE